MRTRDRSRQTSLFRYSPLVAALACALAPPGASAVTYIVNNTGDTPGVCSTSCSLRQAVDTAVANCGSDPAPVIAFAIPGTGPFVISPATTLNFSCGIQPMDATVDGSTQPGYQPTTDPNGFNAAGIQIVLDGAGTSDFNGVLHSNAFPYGNSLTLIGVEVRNYTYGGLGAITGNVRVRGSHVHGNTFGLDPRGFDATNRAVVGGAGLTARNLIRNNSITGIDISYGGFADVINNIIGLDAAGSAPNSNNEGIVVEASQDVTIQQNYISGNSGSGIRLTNTTNAPHVSITQNKIGVTPQGGAAPNGTGVKVENSVASIVNNTIASNVDNGVRVFETLGSSSAVISQNSIHSNGLKNIDLDFAGAPLPNDVGDADTGPNGRQNHPIITSVIHSGGSTQVQWSLNSEASQSYAIEFFSNAAPGTPAGTTHQGGLTQSTDGTGNVSGPFVISGLQNNISATATNVATSRTSEFSAAVALTPTPAVTVSPNPVSFPDTTVGGSSGPTAITLTSVGTAPYVINQFDSAPTCYGGPICATGEFACAVGCSTATPYATSASCAINVTFTPSTAGPHTTTFYICDNASGSPRSVTLSGNGLAPPPATIGPTNFNFGTVPVGGFSAFQSFTVTNGGPTSIALSAFSTTGPFQVVNATCGATLGPSASCNVDGRFAPTAGGPANGTLSASAGAGTVTATLSGNGLAPPPTTISPVSFNFGTWQVGTTSSNGFFTINNPSLIPVTLDPLVVTAPFALVSTNCPATLPPQSSCSATANYAPTAVGPASGSLSTNANGTPLSASLSGTGDPIPPPPSVAVTPTNANYGAVTVGASSAPLAFTISNPANVAATLGAQSTTGPYSISSTTCTTSIAPFSSCNTSVAFQPSAPGAAPGTLVVPASTGTATANLTGTGLAAASLSLSPPSFSFGEILVGSSSVAKTFTLTNPNTVPVPIQPPTVTGPFAITATSCGPTVSAGASCETNVRFTPTANGPIDGLLTIDSVPTPPGGAAAKSGAFGSASAVLSGTGLLQSTLTMPTSIDLGAGTLGGAPVQRAITLNNSGNAALTIDSVTIAPPFTVTHACPLNLLPGDSCTVVIAHDPVALGEFTGALVVLSNSAGGSRSVPVKVNVQARPEPVIRVQPQSIGFGHRMAGTQAPAQRITISNEGGGDAAGVQLVFDTVHFLVQNTNCGQAIAAQSTCFADVVFAPQGFGPRRDTFNVRSNAPDSPARVSVSGAGCRPIQVTQGRGSNRLNCAP